MVKFLRKLALFLGILLVINITLNSIFDRHGNERFDYRYDYFLKHEDRYNTVFWGTSRTLRHCIPGVFDSLNHQDSLYTKSFNLATPASTSFENYLLYDRFLDTYEKDPKKTIRYAFMEINPLSYVALKNVATRDGNYYLTADNFMLTLKSIFNSKIAFRHKAFSAFTSTLAFGIRYAGFNYAYTNLQQGDISYYLGKKGDGYISLEDEARVPSQNRDVQVRYRQIFLQDTLALHKRTAEVENDFSRQVYSKFGNEVHLKRIEGLRARSKKLGINLVFLVQPRLEDYKEINEIVAHLPKNAVIEIADPKVYKNMWRVDNSYDVGHMQQNGGRQLTAVLSDQFQRYIRR